MKLTSISGHRAPSLAAITNQQILDSTQPDLCAAPSELIKLAKQAACAIGLRTLAGQLLEKLAACYQRPVNGRLLVWPSNEWLVAECHADERSIRRSIQQLISLGLIVPKDDPRRKRYARIDRTTNTVLDAYGFDLSPMWLRRDILMEKLAQDDRAAKEMRALDIEIMRNCIAARSALSAAREYDSEGLTVKPLQQLSSFETALPRSKQQADRPALLLQAQQFRTDAERIFLNILGGSSQTVENPSQNDENVRPGRTQSPPLIKDPYNTIKDYNELGSENHLNSVRTIDRASGAEHSKGLGFENSLTYPDQKGDPALISMSLLREACPDLSEFGDFRQPAQLCDASERIFRPMIQASRDAWVEAVQKLGLAPASVLVAYVLQVHIDKQKSGTMVAGVDRPGGLFRHLVRQTTNGQFSLFRALQMMRRNRMS